jgi:DNA-directed RNA polymerase subunit M/transcription elongation factor TFIIS
MKIEFCRKCGSRKVTTLDDGSHLVICGDCVRKSEKAWASKTLDEKKAIILENSRRAAQEVVIEMVWEI